MRIFISANLHFLALDFRMLTLIWQQKNITLPKTRSDDAQSSFALVLMTGAAHAQRNTSVKDTADLFA